MIPDGHSEFDEPGRAKALTRARARAEEARPKDGRPELAERYQNIAVDKIVINGDKATIRGSYGRLAVAVQGSQEAGLDQVPGFMGDWRARRDSNPWPLPPEGSALSS